MTYIFVEVDYNGVTEYATSDTPLQGAELDTVENILIACIDVSDYSIFSTTYYGTATRKVEYEFILQGFISGLIHSSK